MSCCAPAVNLSPVQQCWGLTVDVLKLTAAMKEIAKIISNLWTLAAGAIEVVARASVASAFITVLDLPGVIKFFVDGKCTKCTSVKEFLATAAAVAVLVVSLLGVGKALDTIFGCMGWVSSVVGNTIASTPFGIIISIASLPASLFTIGSNVMELVDPKVDPHQAARKSSDCNQIAAYQKKEAVLRIAGEVLKIAGTILTIVGIAMGIAALSTVGAVVAITGAVVVITRIFLEKHREKEELVMDKAQLANYRRIYS